MCLHAYSVWNQVHMSEGVHEARRRDLHQLELKLLAEVSYLMKEKTSRDCLSQNTVIKTWHGCCTAFLTEAEVAGTKSSQSKFQPGKGKGSWGPTHPQPLAICSWWLLEGIKSVFLRGVTPGRLPVLPWVALHIVSHLNKTKNGHRVERWVWWRCLGGAGCFNCRVGVASLRCKCMKCSKNAFQEAYIIWMIASSASGVSKTGHSHI